MSDAASLQSGKGHNDENFPVASFVIAARHRPAVLAFYNFVRTADDVADNAQASADEKLAILEDMRRTLMGASDVSREGVKLRAVLDARKLSTDHAADLLEAFRRDVTKLRYADWDELLDYCRYSAMPVGRYVLDVHGEGRSSWPLNDALCAALQIINHLQDCGKDFREINRVYLPDDILAKHGATVDMLGAAQSRPPLKAVLAELAAKNADLLAKSAAFAGAIKDPRLAFEVALIQRFAEDLNIRLFSADPLCDRVHHRKSELIPLAVSAFGRFVGSRFARKSTS
jgi:squalene synthase HpnC